MQTREPIDPLFEPTIKLVHADRRGEIYAISLPEDRELMLLHSKQGSIRGGHSHDVPEVVMMLTGKMRYRKIIPGGESQRILDDGGVSLNEAGRIHMGEFLEDTWLLEFKLARKGTWTQQDYAPWREQVEANAGV